MPNAKLQIIDVSHCFNEQSVLQEINLSVDDGEFVAIVGESGSGKSTLFNIIAGLLHPTKGDVVLTQHGERKSILNQDAQVGYMLQKHLLLPFKTLYQNVALPLILQGEKKSEAFAKVDSLLPEFGLQGLGNAYPQTLSGGEKQRAALLRTYLLSRQVVLLDEPFSALDAITKRSMHQWFIDLKAKLQLTCLMVTHDIDEAMLLADSIYVVKGKPATIVERFTAPQDKSDMLSPDVIAIKKRIMQAI